MTPQSPSQDLPFGRLCPRAAIPEIAAAAALLDEAVSAHIAGRIALAQELIESANMSVIREWTESLWGKSSPQVFYRPVPDAPRTLDRRQRGDQRMPTADVKQALHSRDGFHCRFCGIPVIRHQVRNRLRVLYPRALPWGNTNKTCHAAFQAMWAQYDHILPFARGGSNNLENMVIACAPCNYGRMNYTLEEVGLVNPLTRQPVPSTWDGLERLFRQPS
jgi:5-methylcytosine-specific restriction endonuclease McrA